MGRGKRLAILLAAVLLAALAAAAGLLVYWTGRARYVRDEDVEVLEHAYESEQAQTAEGMAETKTQELKAEELYDLAAVSLAPEELVKGTYTLLAVGEKAERETEDGILPGTEEGAEGSARRDADAIIMLTFNPYMGAMFINTFNAELYAEIPGYGPGRLGNAYAVGGGPLLAGTITANYGTPIDNYAAVSLEDVARVIGLEGFEQLEVSTRGVEVIEELVSQLNLAGSSQVAARISELLPYVTTNISGGDMMKLMLKVPEYVSYYSVKNQIPVEGLYSLAEGYIVPDIPRTARLLQELIYQRPEAESES